jgi:hypothetical protein
LACSIFELNGLILPSLSWYTCLSSSFREMASEEFDLLAF